MSSCFSSNLGHFGFAVPVEVDWGFLVHCDLHFLDPLLFLLTVAHVSFLLLLPLLQPLSFPFEVVLGAPLLPFEVVLGAPLHPFEVVLGAPLFAFKVVLGTQIVLFEVVLGTHVVLFQLLLL